MYICVPTEYLMLEEARRSHLILWTWSYRQLWPSTCILRTEHVSSASTASALNHRDISPDPQILLKWLLNMNFTSFMFLRIWGCVCSRSQCLWKKCKSLLGKYLEVFHFGIIFYYFCQKKKLWMKSLFTTHKNSHRTLDLLNYWQFWACLQISFYSIRHIVGCKTDCLKQE